MTNTRQGERSDVISSVLGVELFLQEKCADYLPPSEVTDCHRLFGDFQVTLKKREVKDKYVVSSIQLKVCIPVSHLRTKHVYIRIF